MQTRSTYEGIPEATTIRKRFTISRNVRRVVVFPTTEGRHECQGLAVELELGFCILSSYGTELKGGFVPIDKFAIPLRTLGQELKTYGHTWMVALETASPETLQTLLGYGVS